MKTKSGRFEVDAFIWVTAFILANLRGTVVWDILKQGFQLTALPWIEIFVWAVLFVMAVWSLIHENSVVPYLRLWKQNWVLIVFIGVAFLSIFWSVSPSASLYRTAALLFASLIGAYIGSRYSCAGLLAILFRFGTLLLIICFVLALFLPVAGRMDFEPYNGAWRGLFWHKNQFGCLAALFSLVFLVGGLHELERKGNRALLYLIFYLFSLVVIYFSKSVAGYLLVILMSFCTALAFGWLKLRHRLRAVHYYGALAFSVLTAAALVLNLDVIFRLFNRDTSLTGRVPLWIHLYENVFLQSPWLGHGFGALWSLASFRTATQQAVGWYFPVAIGDNGFLDILLHVGLVGFVPFLVVLILSFVRAARFAFDQHSLEGFFPLLFMLFLVAANISFSFFLETETFLWLILVAVLFLLTRTQQDQGAPEMGSVA